MSSRDRPSEWWMWPLPADGSEPSRRLLSNLPEGRGRLLRPYVTRAGATMTDSTRPNPWTVRGRSTSLGVGDTAPGRLSFSAPSGRHPTPDRFGRGNGVPDLPRVSRRAPVRALEVSRSGEPRCLTELDVPVFKPGALGRRATRGGTWPPYRDPRARGIFEPVRTTTYSGEPRSWTLHILVRWYRIPDSW